MHTAKQIAKHFREVHFGGNWTTSNLKDNLKDISWTQATTQVYNLNSIATLTYHIHYYVHAVLDVLKGSSLNAKDEYSFNHPPIESQNDWEQFLNLVWTDAEQFANLVETLPEEIFEENFTDAKYGIYYRNLHGIIEHSHYHLGQIALIKKILHSKGIS